MLLVQCQCTVLSLIIVLVSLAMSASVSDPPSQCLLAPDCPPPYHSHTINCGSPPLQYIIYRCVHFSIYTTVCRCYNFHTNKFIYTYWDFFLPKTYILAWIYEEIWYFLYFYWICFITGSRKYCFFFSIFPVFFCLYNKKIKNPVVIKYPQQKALFVWTKII